MPISSMIHQPSFSRFRTDPAMLKMPSTSTDAAKKVAITHSATPGLTNARHAEDHVGDAADHEHPPRALAQRLGIAAETRQDSTELAIVFSQARRHAV